MLLEGRVALVTGASRGIGRAIATAFARQGATLVISSSTPAIHEVASELSGAGHSVLAVEGNVGEEAHQKELIQLVRKTHGRLDVLVNNAGVLLQARIGMTSMEDVRRMFDINVFAVFNLMQYATRLMTKSVDPNIINLASIAGTSGMEGVAAYSASKGAVAAMTLAAAKELAPAIRVNAIAPGFIESPMTNATPVDWRNKFIESTAMKRIGQPQDVANAAVYLAGSMGGYITGQILGVDGGMSA